MILAVWSGPRNLSTALMYAFAARGDCDPVDEPFYAAYLAATGLHHPMQAEVLASQSQDPEAVVAGCLEGPVPGRIAYQKHMCQHMLPGFRRDWLRSVTNVFLIRHPARVVASYAAKRENPTLDDIGFRQQAELFDLVADQRPPVIDSADIRADPARSLQSLCKALGLDWTPAMLCWPAGAKPFDGVWSPHWYGSVHRSTGFEAAEGPLPELTGAAAALVEQALPYYRRLSQHRLT